MFAIVLAFMLMTKAFLLKNKLTNYNIILN